MWWHEPTAHTPDGEGFWSVATYAEALAGADATPTTYSSETGGDRPYGGTLLQDLPVAGHRAQHDGRPAPRAGSAGW